MPIQQMFLGLGAVATKTYMDDVFSTYLYKGTGSSKTVTTGIDQSGEGSLTWIKKRNGAVSHQLFDTVRGAGKVLYSDLSSGGGDFTSRLSSFTSTGFTLGNNGAVNASGDDYTSWTFRKAPGFFTIKEYTGTGSSQAISHDLGSMPGLIIVKLTSSSGGDWAVWQRDLGTEPELGQQKYVMLNRTNTAYGDGAKFSAAPTATTFSVGTSNDVNGNGNTYIAYIFAGGESTAATARSVDFDGSGDSLSIADSEDFNYGSGDFTLEFWVNPNSASQNEKLIHCHTNGSIYGPCNLFMNNGVLELYSSSNNSSFDVVSAGSNGIFGTLAVGQWSHVAVSRQGNNIRIFLNGILKGTTSYSGSLMNATSTFDIAERNGGSYFDGKISSFRVVKGTAVYTSSFKPPYEPLTNITNTKLLCCNNSSTTGSTVTPGTITANGDPTASTDSPFDDPAGFVFGESGSENVIKCGSYIGNGSTTGPEINLGWEPQWLLCKKINNQGGGVNTSNWHILDSMRGTGSGGADVSDDVLLMPNLTNAEVTIELADFASTGFKNTSDRDSWNHDGDEYIYMCIRRPDGYVGKPPDAGTDVFTIDLAGINAGDPSWISNFPVDMQFIKDRNGTTYNFFLSTRQSQGDYLSTATTGAAIANAVYKHDYSNGWGNYASNDATLITSWMWKRHAGFDVVTYKGGGAASAPRSFAHSLAKTPEMIWTKNRDSAVDWVVWHKGLNGGGSNAAPYNLRLNDTDTESSNGDIYGGANNVLPTSTHWTTGGNSMINENGSYFTAILFASVSGISKVGYYDGSDSNQTITTGFQTRFLIIKNITTSAEGYNWYVFDTVRGWDVSSSVKILTLDTTSSESNTLNMNSNPTSTGFTLTGSRGGTNDAGEKYIYYAHA